jgi:hypothetical protein
MKQTIVLLWGSARNSHHHERNGIKYLSKNFKLIHFNCLPLLNRNNSYSDFDSKNIASTIEISSFDQLHRCLNTIKPDYAIDLIGPTREMLQIARILDNLSVKLIVQNIGPIQVPYRIEYWKYLLKCIFKKSAVKVNSGNLIKQKRSNLFTEVKIMILIRTLFVNFNAKIVRVKLSRIRPYAAIVVGTKGLNYYTKNAKFKIESPSYDYYRYQLLSKKLVTKYTKKDRKYIVFIDDNLTSGLDFELIKITEPIHDKPLYFTRLNLFFDYLEFLYGCPLIISGHPSDKNRAQYSSNFQGRTIVYDKTAELVSGSLLVVIQASTAVSFAVQSMKTILSVTSNELEDSFIGPQIRSLSKKVGSTYINIDKFSPSSFKIQEINEKKYLRYLNEYIAISKFECKHPMEFLSALLTQNNLLNYL